MGVTFLDANGLNYYNIESKKSIGLSSSTNNSIQQLDNEALGEHNANFGMHNKTLTPFAYAEGFMNLSGFKLNDDKKIVIENISEAETSETSDSLTLRTSKIRTTTKPNITTDPEDADNTMLLLQSGDMVVIKLDTYYLAKFLTLTVNDGNYYELEFLNHNIANYLSGSGEKSFDLYKIDESTISEECHTEHLEGRYNITAATGSEAFCARLNHIEGTSNVSFGQYNHLEGVSNQALNKSEMMHIEGRFNVATTTDAGSNLGANIGGDANRVENSPYGQTRGYKNDVKRSSASFTGGSKNTVSNAKSSIIYGSDNNVENISCGIVVGEGLKASDNNKAVFGKYNAINTDASIIIGSGDSKKSKNIFEIYPDGNINITNIKGNLESLQGKLTDIDTKLEVVGKEAVGEESSSQDYHFPKGDLTVIENLDGVDSITSYSKNLLPPTYPGGTWENKDGLSVINENGILKVYGVRPTEGSWPRYSLLGSSVSSPILLPQLKPGTYRFGVIKSDKSVPLTRFEVTYYYDSEATQTELAIIENNSDMIYVDIEWQEGFSLKNIVIQFTKNHNYGPEVADFDSIESKFYPFIYNTNNPYLEDNLYKYCQYIATEYQVSNIDRVSIDTSGNQDGIITLSHNEAIAPIFKDYVDVDYASKNYVQEQLGGYKIEVVDSAPENADDNTIYFIR